MKQKGLKIVKKAKSEEVKQDEKRILSYKRVRSWEALEECHTKNFENEKENKDETV